MDSFGGSDSGGGGGIGGIAGAFGAGKVPSLQGFNPIEYIKKPQVILRLFSLLFSIIVFGCISSQGYANGTCLYDGDGNACGYGVGIGVLAFLISIAFLIIDFLFDTMTSVNLRKKLVIADMAVNGFWGFLWFVGFCYLTNKWTTMSKEFSDQFPETSNSASNLQAAIAFCFFSIITFVGVTVLAVMKFRQGVSENFASQGGFDGGLPPPGGAPGGGPGGGYAAYPDAPESGNPYQAPPFSQQGGGGGGGQPPSSDGMAPSGGGGGTADFQQPTY